MEGKQLKAFLVSRGVQQKDLSNFLGVPKQTISAALGSDDIRSSLLEKVAAMLNVPISQLYGETGPTFANAAEGGTAIAGSGNNLNVQVDKFLDLLKEKDVQLARSQGEIDKLLDLLKDKLK